MSRISLLFASPIPSPPTTRHLLAGIRAEWERRYPNPRDDDAWDELARELFRHVEASLDQGLGSCLLSDSAISHEVDGALRHFDGERYELGCYAIMPNHMHLVVRPYSDEDYPLEAIVQSWKRFTSRYVHQFHSDIDPVWQPECFDRIIRDEEHLFRCVQYVGNNPRRAELKAGTFRRWAQPSWEKLGWGFRD